MDKAYTCQISTVGEPGACFCIGPQHGEPLCPCRMRNLRQENGRWIEVIDCGPVVTVSPPTEPACLHDQCTNCHGTGIGPTGGSCIHGISCPCPKCTVR